MRLSLGKHHPSSCSNTTKALPSPHTRPKTINPVCVSNVSRMMRWLGLLVLLIQVAKGCKSVDGCSDAPDLSFCLKPRKWINFTSACNVSHQRRVSPTELVCRRFQAHDSCYNKCKGKDLCDSLFLASLDRICDEECPDRSPKKNVLASNNLQSTKLLASYAAAKRKRITGALKNLPIEPTAVAVIAKSKVAG